MKKFLFPLLTLLFMATVGCNESSQPKYSNPTLRSQGLEFQTQQEADLVAWAIKRFGTPNSVHLKHIKVLIEPWSFDGAGEVQYFDAALEFLFEGNGRSVQHWIGLERDDTGDYTPGYMGIGVTCTGVNCAKCVLKGVYPNTECTCMKVSNPDGPPMECNMTTDISIGGISREERELFTVDSGFEIIM